MPTTRFIWSRRIDLAVFGGSALIALALAAASPWLSTDGAMPAWAWIAFVLALDVAHVWSMLFRTYLDGDELSRRRALYMAMPVICYLGGVALYQLSSHTFWRFIAYAAVFHFVRQQIGWVAIYRARAGERAAIDRWLDEAVVYAATCWPLLWWHTHLPRAFSWMMADDFIDLSLVSAAVTPLGWLYVALLIAYAARATWRHRAGSFNLGKHLVVASTAAVWYVGIVATDSDYAFTVTNVTIHGIPYVALLWMYARERARERPRALIGRIVALGFGAFVAVALWCAFCEELLWDRLVWHDRGYLFGASEPWLSDRVLSFVVPLLALPQLVHYALDGVLWRSKDAGAAQARALGFSPAAS